jgi:hypothetical protein
MPMRRDALLPGRRYRFAGLPVPAQHYRRQPHDRPIAGRLCARRSGDRVAGSPETLQSLSRRDADIDAIAGRRIFALAPPPHETLHEIALIEAATRDQAVGETQREARVIGPLPWLEATGATADHVGEGRVRVALRELQSRAQRIAHCQPEKAPEGAVHRGIVGHRRSHNIGDWPAGQDVPFLLAGFDRPGPDMPDGTNCVGGVGAQLDEQSSRDHPRTAETTSAMNKYAAAASNNPAQIGTGGGPPNFEPLIGYGNIDDRQMNPPHSVSLNHAREI